MTLSNVTLTWDDNDPVKLMYEDLMQIWIKNGDGMSEEDWINSQKFLPGGLGILDVIFNGQVSQTMFLPFRTSSTFLKIIMDKQYTLEVALFLGLNCFQFENTYTLTDNEGSWTGWRPIE